MSGDTSNPSDSGRPRRSSVSATSTFSNLFQRANSTSTGTPAIPGPLTAAAMNDQNRRRLSITTLGLSGTSPSSANAFGIRRSSMSTNNSDTVDENAVEEDDLSSARTGPNTPFTRRMSFGAQAMRNLRTSTGSSPGSNNGRPSPPLRRTSTARTPPTPPSSTGMTAGFTWSGTSSQASTAANPRTASDLIASVARSDQGFNWSEQLRSRAESSVASGARPSFSLAAGLSGSPPRAIAGGGGSTGAVHDRAKSVSDMPAPPAQAPKPRQQQKPDHFQERILKGDFYMD